MLEMAAEKPRRRKSTTAQRETTAELYARHGKKGLTTFLPEEMIRALKFAALERETTLQDLITEFLNDGLVKIGKKRIE